ncbi:hypothetical protein DSM19430T_12570 [Desulfovibrio psychrotolerans]|uniref:Uncharacterized protein n=1 Tax=Desulfovibrio psychrotolerans TaxID=415242 RepID=A0A7J0BS81_9BACT|nr:hypothetical protein DSM19430T_12570 [Desulfovibrio psychrotolerans]
MRNEAQRILNGRQGYRLAGNGCLRLLIPWEQEQEEDQGKPAAGVKVGHVVPVSVT